MTMNDIKNVEKNGYKIISTFSGMGGTCLGYKMAGFDVGVAVEFIPEAAKTYKWNNPGVPVIEADVRHIKGSDLLAMSGMNKGEVPVVEGSPPCFTAGQLIVTSEGYKKIEDVREGDYVYTHKGRFKKVIKTMVKDYSGDMVKIKVYGQCDSIEVTPEHPFYVFSGEVRNFNRGDLKWVPAEKLNGGHFVSYNLGNRKNESVSRDLMMLLGYYVLYGFIDKSGRTIISMPKRSEGLEECMENLNINYSNMYEYKGKSCYPISNSDISDKCKSLGNVYDKRIVEDIISADRDCLLAFLKPLVDSKEVDEGRFFYSFKEKKIALCFQRILVKVGVFARVYRCLSDNKKFYYYALVSDKREWDWLKRANDISESTWFKNDNIVLSSVMSVDKYKFNGKVYNLEVDYDNSYCLNLVSVHNCSDFSSQHYASSGKEIGKVKTYSSTKQRVDDLFFEFSRLVGDVDPYVFTAENVESLFDEDKQEYLDGFIHSLENTGTYGYNVSVKLIDFSLYGVPQQRKRAIFLGVRKDLGIVYPPFPECPNLTVTTRMAIEDLIESEPDMEMTDLEKKYARMIPVGSGVDYLFMLRNKYKQKIMVFNHRRDTWDIPHPTLVQNTRHLHPLKNRWLTVAEAKRLHTIPDDFELFGTPAQQWERVGRAVPPLGMFYIAKNIQHNILDILKRDGKIK